MPESSISEARDPAWLAPLYFSVYLGWLFFSLEGEVQHWATLVLVPLTLVAAFQAGPLRLRLGAVLASVGLRPARLTRGLALTLALCVAVSLFQLAFSNRREEILELLASTRALVVLPAVMLFLVVLTGFTEELFFRGYLQTRLERLTGSRAWGLVLASVLFGVYHLPFAYLNPRWPSAGDWPAAWTAALGQGIPGGLILGGLFLYSGRNLYMPILLHACVDLLPASVLLKFSING